MHWAKSAVLILCTGPLWGSHIIYPTYQIFTAQFITAAKVQLEIVLWFGITTRQGTVLKDGNIGVSNTNTQYSFRERNPPIGSKSAKSGCSEVS